MKRIMQFFKKNIVWVVAVLAVLLLFKSCQSCTRKHAADFERAACAATADSLNCVITKQNDSIIILNGRIDALMAERTQLLNANASLKDASNRPIIIRNIENKQK